MNLQPKMVDIVGQKEFMRNAVGMEFKTGGATLDADEFDDVQEDGVIKAGTAVYKNDDGLYVPWDDPSEDEEGNTDSRDGAGLTASDILFEEDTKPIVGVVVAGHPLEKKCTGVTDAFKDEVKGYLRFDA